MKDQEAIQWRSWDTKVFQEASDLGRPILLSISATWCHWCHVMDEESFTHPEVIRRINDDFIPVRVDSDRRPDINSRYNMGGWPTVAILNLEGKVMAGGTYLPIGQLLTMLSSVKRDPNEIRQSPLETAEGADLRVCQGRPHGAAPTIEFDESLVQTVAGFLERAFDPHFGGFGGPPKFPQPWAIELAFHLGPSMSEKKWLEMATLTLDNMREGEIYDTVEGGFFRYATRGDWDNPHYEKLLETNARMLSLYLKAYQLTGQMAYRATAQGILGYLFSALLAVPGQPWFCGSQSADHDYYALREEERLEADVPPLDQTIYVDRNAMAASALLSAHHVLGNLKYQDAALKLIDFLWTHFYQPGQGMFHYSEGLTLPRPIAINSAMGTPTRGMGALEDSSLPQPHGSPHIIDGKLMLLGYLSDQVYMMMALMDAFEATGSRVFLSRADDLVKSMDHHLRDNEEGGYWDLPADSQALGVLKIRIKPFVENAVTAMALTRLYHLTGQEAYQQCTEATLRHLTTVFTTYKHHAAPFAVALERFLKPPHHVTLIGKHGDARWMELLQAAHQLKSVWKVVLPLDADQDLERLSALGYPPSDEPLAYLCIGKTCLPPVSRPEELFRAAT